MLDCGRNAGTKSRNLRGGGRGVQDYGNKGEASTEERVGLYALLISVIYTFYESFLEVLEDDKQMRELLYAAHRLRARMKMRRRSRCTRRNKRRLR